jgi:photosystem II stability/assembly factor-like uncharacterized protein
MNYIIVGDDGKIIKTTNSGDTWSWSETGVRNNFYSLDFFDKNLGAVVGDSGILVITDDGGKKWKTINLEIDILNTVKILSEDLIVAAGTKGKIFISNDFGETWKLVNSDENIDIYDLYFINELTGFACSSSGLVLKTTNSGNSWQKFKIANDSFIFKKFDFSGDYAVCVGGDTTIGVYQSIIMYSTDSGNNWVDLNCPVHTILTSVNIFDESSISTIGLSGRMCFTSNKGESWELDTLDNSNYFYQTTTLTIFNSSADDKGNVLAIGRDNVIAYSGNYGRNFEVRNWVPTYYIMGARGKMINKILFASEKNYFAIGEWSKIFQSKDRGVTWNTVFIVDTVEDDGDNEKWSNMNKSNVGFTDGFFRDSNNAIIVGRKFGTYDANTVFTQDAGKTWIVDHKIRASHISFINDSIGFSTFMNEVHKTTDFGKTWTKINLEIENLDIINSVNFKSELTGYIVCLGDGNSKLFKTTDGGLSFNKILMIDEKSRQFSRMSWYNQDYGILYGYSKIVLKTTDGGDHWVDYFLPDAHELNDLLFLDSLTAIACGKNDTIFYTYDGCITWEYESLKISKITSAELPSYFTRISKSTTGDLFLCGRGRILKGNIKQDTSTNIEENIDIYINPLYLYLHPNPTQKHIYIKLYGTKFSKNGPLKCKIYNFSGIMVKDVSKEANYNNNGHISDFEVNTNDLSAGIYFVQMQSGQYIRTQKFMISD